MRKQAALITGGAIRIGKAIALGLAQKGYDIALHYNHSEKEALKTQTAILKYGVQCHIYRADFLNRQETQALIGRVQHDFKHLSILINNASLYTLGSPREHMLINFKAPVILTKEWAKRCITGHIINILDSKITQNKTRYPEYLASKKALYVFTRKAALKLAPNIQVNAIAPGVILPPFSKGKNYLPQRIQQIPLKQKGDVKYIVHAVTFLLENPFITGDTLFIDGGEHLLGPVIPPGLKVPFCFFKTP